MSERTDPLARALSLPIWQGPASAMRLGGGITNLNVLVTDCGRRAVVRIGDDIPVHQIMRFNELAASHRGHRERDDTPGRRLPRPRFHGGGGQADPA